MRMTKGKLWARATLVARAASHDVHAAPPYNVTLIDALAHVYEYGYRAARADMRRELAEVSNQPPGAQVFWLRRWLNPLR
ncbi:MAG: hypothetical protein KGL39_09605 [Patescibacteria group bacterium]|nr:hypothetical protein [Patescibacteria group bacterium]